ncbi:MAG TPA: ATP-binding protein, partial [Symbiobacteriaceae bacterium]|nr:ATP-binding protein [Symbiobacteriaceae bacterium]
DLPHIFDRFYRADKARSRATGGSGLGLAIVRSLITLHGGTVQAESTPGEGSRFTVALPLEPPAAGGGPPLPG